MHGDIWHSTCGEMRGQAPSLLVAHTSVQRLGDAEDARGAKLHVRGRRQVRRIHQLWPDTALVVIAARQI